MKEYCFKVSKKFNNVSCFEFLKAKNFSLEIIKKIKFGGVFVNEIALKNINDHLKYKDNVKIVLPKDKINDKILISNDNLNVLYEDEYLIAIDKESGVLTHSAKYNGSKSIESMLYGYNNLDYSFRPINRLDKDTSGIILIAKDEYCAGILGEQIKRGKIKKTYLCVVKNKPKLKRFIIEKPIKRVSEDSIKREVDSSGQYAKTECKVIKNLEGNKFLIKVNLFTGRTHQIRVHLSSIGSPLYADSLYGEKVKGKTYLLNANKLEFIHPIKNKKIRLKSKIFTK